MNSKETQSVRPADRSDDPVLLHHRQIWNRRRLLREIYHDLYQRMISWLSRKPGPTVELGAGGGNFKDYYPNTIASDITWCSWLDVVADATHLPFADGRVSNIVMFDAFHHIPYPVRLLEEARRVLAPGGRIIMCEPYMSWVSYPFYRYLHREGSNYKVKPLEMPPDQPIFPLGGPWSSNQAIPTALFWRDLSQVEQRFPCFRILHKQAMSTFIYPPSGGYEKRRLLPQFTWPLAWVIERCTEPLAPWIGFRCLVVLERCG